MQARTTPTISAFFTLALAFAATLISPSALATTFADQPFPEAVQDAPIIVRGKVGGKYANWGVGRDGSRNIYTYIELSSEEVLKGEVSSPNVVMREMGGEKDGVGMQVAGTAHFDRGEDVVVFLSSPANPDGSYSVRGMMMAKLNVERNEEGQEVLHGPALGLGRGRDHVDEDGHGGEKKGQDDTRGQNWTLDALRNLIRDQGPPANAAPSPLKSQEKPKLAESLPSTHPSAEATRPSAPQLQPTEEARGPAWRYLWIALVVALGIMTLIFKQGRGRNRKS